MSRFLPDILDQHLDELDELTARRAYVFQTGAHTAKQVVALDARILTHADGLVLAGDEALPVLDEALQGDDAGRAGAAALGLLFLPTADRAQRVAKRLASAEEEELVDALARALWLAPAQGDALDVELERIIPDAPPRGAALATAVLARRDRLAGTRLLVGLLGGEASARWALEALAHLPGGKHDLSKSKSSAWKRALERWAQQDDAPLRAAALHAAVWMNQGWLPERLRKVCAEPATELREEHRLLAALGDPADVPVMLALGANEALGPERCALLSAHGHPELLLLLVKLMEAEDPATAAAAAEAYTGITGVPMLIPGQRAHAPSAEGEEDFAEDFGVPDVARARAHCESTRAHFGAQPRWLRGRPEAAWHPLDRELPMRSRQVLCLSRRMQGVWKGRRVELDAFPLAVTPR